MHGHTAELHRLKDSPHWYLHYTKTSRNTPPTLDKYHSYSPYLSIVPHFNGSDKTKKRKKIRYFLNNDNWITFSKISWFVDDKQIHYSTKPEAEKKIDLLGNDEEW